jgi:hypothetical protein
LPQGERDIMTKMAASVHVMLSPLHSSEITSFFL